MKTLRLCMGIAAAILFAICGTTVLAEGELSQKSRPALGPDMPGTWEMVYQKHGKVPAADSLFFARHQRFQFTADGRARNLASVRPFDAVILSVWENAPLSTRFRFSKPGVMNVVRSPRDQDWIVISVITADLKKALVPDAPLLKKGDLILAYMTPEKRVYMHRYLRRIP